MKTKILYPLAALLFCAGCYLPKNSALPQMYSESFMVVLSVIIAGFGIKLLCQGYQMVGIILCFVGVLWFFLA